VTSQPRDELTGTMSVAGNLLGAKMHKVCLWDGTGSSPSSDRVTPVGYGGKATKKMET